MTPEDERRARARVLDSCEARFGATGRTGRRLVGLATLLATLLLAGLVSGSPSKAQSPESAPPSAAAALPETYDVWESLHYRGRNWLARFSAQLDLTTPGRGEDPGTEPWVADLRTSLGSVVLSDKSTLLRASFDPATAFVPLLTQLSLGPSPDYKRYEFDAGGAKRVRREPAAGQDVLMPEAWPEGRSSEHPYDSRALGCRVVSSPGALAWWLTWGPGASWAGREDPRACYFLGKTLYRVFVEPRGESRARVDYQLVRGGKARRRAGRVRVERFEVISRPIAGKLDEKTIVAEILLDAENRLVWRFVMREGPIEIDIELDRAVLGETARLKSASPGAVPR